MKKSKMRGERAQIKAIRRKSAMYAVAVFFSLFMTIAIIGSLCFETDSETNTLQMPNWFCALMLFMPVVGAIATKKSVRAKLNKQFQCSMGAERDKFYAGNRTQENQQPAHIAEEETRKDKPVTINVTNELDVIRGMEKRFEDMYEFAYNRMLNAEDCKRAYNALVKNFDYSTLPLAAQVRLEQLCDEYKEKFGNPNPMVYVDSLTGADFEQWCARLLLRSGFDHAEVTPSSGDQGVDIIASKDGILYAIQCKRYSSDLGNTPVQEVFAGKEMYACQVAVVMTNVHFTPGAKALAAKTKVLLWDREKLIEMIQAYGRV